MPALKLTRGTYYAGIDRPWYASREAVRSRLLEHIGAGGTVRFFERDAAKPPPVDPKRDPTYSEDWDEWIEVRYLAADRTVTVPRRWAWLVRVSAAAGKEPTRSPAIDEPDPAGVDPLVLLVPLVAVAVWWRNRGLWSSRI